MLALVCINQHMKCEVSSFTDIKPTPPLYGAPVGGDPIWISPRSLASEN